MAICDPEDPQRIISALNLMIQQHAGRTGKQLGTQEASGASKYFFGPDGKRVELTPAVELWKGFFVSASLQTAHGELVRTFS